MIKKLDTHKLLSILWLLVAYFLLLSSIIIGYNFNFPHNLNYAFYGLGLVLYGISIKIKFRIDTKAVLQKLEENWQNKESGSIFSIDLMPIKEDAHLIFGTEQDTLDDNTWHDLHLDKLYHNMNYLFTTPGEVTLYSLLRNPLKDPKCLSRRNKLIELLRNDKISRQYLQEMLLKLHKDGTNSVNNLLYEKIPEHKLIKVVCRIGTILHLGSWLSLIFGDIKSSIFALILTFIFNSLFHLYTVNKVLVNLGSFQYLRKVVKTGSEIIKNAPPELNSIIREYFPKGNMANGFLKKTFFINPIVANPDEIWKILTEYFNMTFLPLENSFFLASEELKIRKEHFKKLYSFIGELDSMLCAAKLKENLTVCCKPKFTKDNQELEFNDLIHPLLPEAIPNSFSLNNNGIIVTGSNMSGKSTFMRTIGINIVLAQVFNFACAKSFQTNYYSIISSMNQSDSLLTGKSFYYSEAERILKIINLSKNRENCLCLIDEMLKGTNSQERISASNGILKYLLKNRSVVFVSTHDLELVSKLGKLYDCYHFTDDVDEEGIIFDFKLKKGVSNKTNAIRLMKQLRYPKEVFVDIA